METITFRAVGGEISTEVSHSRGLSWVQQMQPALRDYTGPDAVCVHKVGVLCKSNIWIHSFGRTPGCDKVTLTPHPRFYHQPVKVKPIPWESRIDKACFRARQPTAMRRRVCELGFAHGHLLNACLAPKTSPTWVSKYYAPNRTYLLEREPIGWIGPALMNAKFFMTPQEQANYRYLIDYGGTDSLLWKLLSGACVIRIAGEPEFWPDTILREGEHYLRAKIEDLYGMLANRDDGLARRIGEAGREAALRHLMPEQAKAYFHKVLAECAVS